jgi:D-3-phosphoglycerate dehydrogenase
MKVLISTTSFAEYDHLPLDMIRRRGLEIQMNPLRRKLTEEEIADLIPDFEGLIAGTEPLTEKVMKNAKRLRVISRCGTGLDNVDKAAAEKMGIKVFNTPGAPTLAVAELTVGLILNLLRKVGQMNIAVKNGRWDKQMGNLLHNKKVGIIGFGLIGQKTGELLSGFGVELAHCDIESKTCSLKCDRLSFEDILGWADVITLHLSPPKGCDALIGNRELKLMKKGSWLINVSRGGMVDEKALYEHLRNGHLSGAALDVFEQEPYVGPLRDLDNVILTPHIGSYAKEARIEMERQAAENLLKGFGVI